MKKYAITLLIILILTYMAYCLHQITNVTINFEHVGYILTGQPRSL